MSVSRRQFVCFLAAAPAAPLAFAQGRAERCAEAERRDKDAARRRASMMERRVYDRTGVIPPGSVLRRCGIYSFHRHDGLSRVTLLMRFASPGERTRAWDRFNTDPEWRALRESGPVLLKEISFPAERQPRD